MSKLTKLFKRIFHKHKYHLDYSLSLYSNLYYYKCKCGKDFTSIFEIPELPEVAQFLERELNK